MSLYTKSKYWQYSIGKFPQLESLYYLILRGQRDRYLSSLSEDKYLVERDSFSFFGQPSEDECPVDFFRCGLPIFLDSGSLCLERGLFLDMLVLSPRVVGSKRYTSLSKLGMYVTGLRFQGVSNRELSRWDPYLC